jgi:hypothetical protein
MNTLGDFKSEGVGLAYSVQDFLLWNSSDLTNNRVGNSLAFFIAANALGVRLNKFVNYDATNALRFKGIEIDVNSAIVFGNQTKSTYNDTVFYFNGGLKYATLSKDRLFIFCLYICQSVSQIDIANLDNWQFYILKDIALRDKINKVNKITLGEILRLDPKICRYSQLKSEIEDVLSSINVEKRNKQKAASLKPLPASLIVELSGKVTLLSDTPISLSCFVGIINTQIDITKYNKLVSAKVADFLVNEGMLSQQPLKGGRYCRVVTEKGKSIGMTRGQIESDDGNTYIGNLYNREAQKYILKNLYAIFMFNKGASVISDNVREDIRKSRALFEIKDCGVNIDDNMQLKKATEHTCRNCMELRRGDCFGSDAICEDFKFSPTFLPKDTTYWPTK